MAPPRRRAITIKHVAAEAGVSLQTVSRVMNNEPNVRDVVKERVKEAVAKLGYVPSLAARRMGGSRSFLLLALNDRDRTIDAWKSRQGTDWVDQMLMGGMLKCAEHGYRLIFELVDTHSAHVEREIMGALSALHPDGVILTPPHSENPVITDLLTAQGIPFARIAAVLEGPGYSISMDDQGAGVAATDHLIKLGHRRIGFITGSSQYAVSGARLAGWLAAMTDAGLATDGLSAEGDFTFESGVRACTALLSLPHPATAIVASNDQMALAVLQVAAQRGLAVPRDLSLISFDDTPIVRFQNPPLTAINHPVAAMTSKAAELLIQARSSEDISPGLSVVPFSLSVRESTAAPRA